MKGTGEGKLGRRIFSFSLIYLLFAIFFAAGVLFSASCTKKYEFSMGNDFIDSQTTLQVIDTFTVDLSTVLLDSITTSSTKIGLAGSYKDDVFGYVKSESYFDFAYEDFPEIEEKAIYDSSSLVLVYTGYTYGDTTQLLSLNIRRLTEKIEPTLSGFLYNNSSFEYSSEITGTISFYPTPNSSDTAIRIPVNSLGEELFTLIREKDEAVSSAEFFSDYLKGFVITSESPGNKSIIGFKADKENLKLKIYYHLDKEELEKKEIIITMGQESHQFNNVNYDLADTPLDSIKAEGNEISSERSDNMGFMQGLTGLLAKVQFPTMQDVLAVKRWKILRAELVLEPARSSYDQFNLPEEMYIYDTDRENRINSILKDDLGYPLTATFEYDEFYGEDTRYTYDITTFINNELADAYFNYDHGLMLGLDQDKFRSSLERLQIEGKNPPVKLRIYFLTY